MDRSEAMFECEVDTDGWDDLRDRLRTAAGRVDELRNKAAALHNPTEYARLDGKLDGIKVALSYMNEWERVHSDSSHSDDFDDDESSTLVPVPDPDSARGEDV